MQSLDRSTNLDSSPALLTDAWIAPASAFNALPSFLLRSLRDRFHLELETGFSSRIYCLLYFSLS
jgi:hypothetical protein